MQMFSTDCSCTGSTSVAVQPPPAEQAPARRKSNCVKEVEKIEERRKARRAAQESIKEREEQEIDKSVPNWEFQRMITCVRR